MTRERFEELSVIVTRRALTQHEAFELLGALLEARPELSAEASGEGGRYAGIAPEDRDYHEEDRA